jgi:hypothetical protein
MTPGASYNWWSVGSFWCTVLGLILSGVILGFVLATFHNTNELEEMLYNQTLVINSISNVTNQTLLSCQNCTENVIELNAATQCMNCSERWYQGLVDGNASMLCDLMEDTNSFTFYMDSSAPFGGIWTGCQGMHWFIGNLSLYTNNYTSIEFVVPGYLYGDWQGSYCSSTFQVFGTMTRCNYTVCANPGLYSGEACAPLVDGCVPNDLQYYAVYVTFPLDVSACSADQNCKLPWAEWTWDSSQEAEIFKECICV